MSKSIFYLSLCHSDSDIAPKFGQNPTLIIDSMFQKLLVVNINLDNQCT